mgnify:FL=1
MPTNNPTYIREWKAKQYAENPEPIRAMNRARYYQKKYDLPIEDIHKYKEYLPIVCKTRIALDALKQLDPDILQEVIKCYAVKPLMV